MKKMRGQWYRVYTVPEIVSVYVIFMYQTSFIGLGVSYLYFIKSLLTIRLKFGT